MTPSQSPLPPEALQLLQDMHGIIAPSSPSWWPVAIGWWAVASLLLAALIALVAWLLHHRQRAANKRALMALVDQLRTCADEDLSSETNRLLKRAALVAFPRERMLINQLFGEEWVTWLNQRSDKPIFTGACADTLVQGGYRSTLLCAREELIACTYRWLANHQRWLKLSGGLGRV